LIPLPRTLAGRVMLIIFAGLVVAHVASFALFEVERSRALDRFAANEVAGRIAEYSRMPASFLVAPSPPTPGAGPRGGAMRQRLRWQEVDTLGEPLAGTTPPSPGFEGEVRRLLTDSMGEDPVAWVSTRELGRPDGMSPPQSTSRPDAPPRPRIVTVALKLPGGRQALAEAPVFLPTVQIPTQAWISIALIFVVTALFSIWAVRLAVQPVRMLSDAADRLSRNIDEPPLPEQGVREIQAAYRAFNRMQDRLKRHVNSRALAFAAMSHDIRTPLTRMRLRLETMDGDAKRKLEEDLAEIESLAQSALEVVRGLAHEEATARVDIDALVERLLKDYAPLSGRIALSGQAPPVDARPGALRRALTNLVDNALKYGNDVTIELDGTREHVSIHVCDRGPGIPAEHLLRVMEPFYRVEASRNRDTGGSGLGLAIAKDIVEGHGGELLIENRAGGGLCATVRLPR
jgi:signal transduction histidine kinase